MKLFAFALCVVTLLPAEVIPDRYIVELTGEPAVARASRKTLRHAVLAHRPAVLAEQAGMRRSVEAVHAEVLESVATVSNALIVRMPASEVDKLRALPGVRAVHKVYRCTLRLDHALNVIHAQDGWVMNGGWDQAGAGIKIGIIDTGIDPSHKGFQDSALQPPAGYPIYSGKDDAAFHNLGKVIVARSYGGIAGGVDTGPADHDGHGSGTAMAAAGWLNSGPLTTIAGSAPKAWLGIYRLDSDLSTDAILKAFDDAVNDGMDVVNISIGIDLPLKAVADPLYDAVERATAAGLIVVAAAGNAGPQPDSVGPPASAPSVIAVGMSWNERLFAGAVAAGGATYAARPGNATYSTDSFTGPLADITPYDSTSEACNALPTGTLSGKVALILRGDCNFSVKLQNAAAAGAVGALVYARPEVPDLFSMDVAGVTFPAASLSYADGKTLLDMAAQKSTTAVVRLTVGAVPIDAMRLVSNSSRGPDAEGRIKPEVLAVGNPIYTAAQTIDSTGDSYNATGYIQTSGTSFASPLVAGVAGLVKQARPGLTMAQYRSMVINSATPLYGDGGKPLRIQEQGAGMVNAFNAVRSTIALEPATLSFGTAASSVDRSLPLSITNLGAGEDIFSITVEPRDAGPAPELSTNTVTLAAGATAKVPVSFRANGLTPGEYQGYLLVQGAQAEVIARVPYWFAMPGDPKYLPLLLTPTSVRRAGATDTFYFQVLDANGVGLPDSQPEVTTATTGAHVSWVQSDEIEVPGGFAVSVRYSTTAGSNVFTFKAGTVSVDLTVTTR